MRIAEELGVAAEIVIYQKTPPDRPALEAIIAKLVDPVTDLVRRDAEFAKLGLTDADVATTEQVIEVLWATRCCCNVPWWSPTPPPSSGAPRSAFASCSAADTGRGAQTRRATRNSAGATISVTVRGVGEIASAAMTTVWVSQSCNARRRGRKNATANGATHTATSQPATNSVPRN